MTDRASDEPSDDVTRIEVLERELERAQRTLAAFEQQGCDTPAHTEAPSRIAELEAELASLRPDATGRRTRFLDRLGKDRPKRLRAEIVRLEEAVTQARPLAVGDRSQLAVLKELRAKRVQLVAELHVLQLAVK